MIGYFLRDLSSMIVLALEKKSLTFNYDINNLKDIV